MTDTPNILGKIEELRKRHTKQEPLWKYVSQQEAIIGEDGSGYMAIGVTGCGDGRTQGGKTANYIADLHNAFPEIAQTLLDAIEAMEQARYQMDFAPPSLKLENARKPIHDFLSRVESPSAS